MKIESSYAEYEMLDRLFGTDTFELFLCLLPDGKTGLLKIAKNIAFNGFMGREVYVLETMWSKVTKIAERGMGDKLGYDHFFPILVESFVSPDHDNRQVNVLSLSEVTDKLSDLVPLEDLLIEEQVRVDPKTSAWILGKLLKLLDFAHSEGVSVPLSGENILIHRERHGVSVFDWTGSTITGGRVLPSVAKGGISKAAREVISALGGDFDKKTIPADDQLEGENYQNFVFGLAGGDYDNARKAHKHFYKLVESMWPCQFHPFTVYPVK